MRGSLLQVSASVALLTFLAVIATLGAGCGQSRSGWPEDAAGLVDQLNSWPSDELDTYERPDAHPGRKPSGETAGWVSEHKAALERLKVKVVWDVKSLKYVIVQ